MRYHPYPEYQKTDVEWLGEIPKHWGYRKLRYYSKQVSTGTTPSGDEYFEDTEVDWYTPSDFDEHNLVLKNSNRKLNVAAIESGAVKNFQGPAVLVVSIGATLGKVGLSELEFSCNQQINVVIPEEILVAKFLAYSLQVKVDVMKIISNSTTLGIMNQEKTKLVEICAPDIEEQQKITTFLDYKTQQIDQLIAKKKALIEKLEEKRIAVITQAVTKGLDKNVTLKPSGVDWLGDVPEHWEIQRFKFCVNIKNIKLEAKETDLGYIGMENIESFTAKKIYDEENPTESEGVGSYYKPNDVLFGKLRPYLAKALLCKEDGICSTELLVFEPEKLLPEYLVDVVLSDWFIEIVNSSTYGAKMPRASWDFIGELRCPFPDLNEQKTIVDFIKNNNLKIEKMLTASRVAISKLEEYRSAIITSAVTGKIDVREFEVSEVKS